MMRVKMSGQASHRLRHPLRPPESGDVDIVSLVPFLPRLLFDAGAGGAGFRAPDRWTGRGRCTSRLRTATPR